MICRTRHRLAIVLFILASVCSCQGESGDEGLSDAPRGIEGKGIAIVVGQRCFKDEELNIPKALFEKEGASVTIVSSKPDTAEGDGGARVKPDVVIDDLDVDSFDVVVFIDGSGVKNDFWENPKAHAVAREAIRQDKILAAICWGPVVLANAGVLEGKKATGHTAQGAERILKGKGCEYTGERVAADGNIITAFGPSSADSFAVAVIEALKLKSHDLSSARYRPVWWAGSDSRTKEQGSWLVTSMFIGLG
jgi:protease I